MRDILALDMQLRTNLCWLAVILGIAAAPVVYPQTFEPQTAEEIEFAEANGFERMPEPPASVAASEFQAIHAMLYAAVRQERDLPAFLAAPLEGPRWLESTILFTGTTDRLRVVSCDERINFGGILISPCRLAPLHGSQTPAVTTALPDLLTALRPVNADDTVAPGVAPPLRVRLANWQAPPTAAPAFPQGGLPRASVSLSPGRNIGSGVWSWRATACNITDVPQQIDQGDIEAVVNSLAIPTIGFGEAKTSNSLFINRSKPVIAAEVTQGIAGLLTGLIASDVISASGIWGAAAVSVFFVTGKLADHFKAVTPADLGTRFAGTAILTDGLSVTLTPRSNPNHCATWEFFTRYSGKKAFARSGIPIY